MRWKTPLALVAILAFLAIHDLCVAEVDAQAQDAKQVDVQHQDAKEDVAEVQYYHDDDGYYHGQRGYDHNRDPSREPTYYNHKGWVNPPHHHHTEITGLKAQIATILAQVTALQAEDQQQWQAIIDLFLWNIIQQEQINTLNNLVQPGGNNSFILPYNQTACLAQGPFNTTFAPQPGKRIWLNVNPDPWLGTSTACGDNNGAPTCETLCASLQMKCDPCAMMQLSCPANLWYGLNWAGYPNSLTSNGLQNWYAFPVFQIKAPDENNPRGENAKDPSQLTGPCPSASPEAGGPFAPGGKVARASGYAQGSCLNGLAYNSFATVKNFVNPNDRSNGNQTTYIEPTLSCQIPLRTRTDTTGGIVYSTICPCATG